MIAPRVSWAVNEPGTEKINEKIRAKANALFILNEVDFIIPPDG